MMLAEIGLGVSVVATALWSGLLLTVTTILHPMYKTQGPSGFAADMRRFLPVARRSPTNYILVLALLIAPVIALIGLWEQPRSAPFLLTAVGYAAIIVGPLLTSRFKAEPNYDVILAWDPEDMPHDWTVVRRRYFRLNWFRGALTWSALGLFFAATYAYIT